MKHLQSILLSLLTLAFMACGNERPSLEAFDRELYTPRYAQGFTLRATESGSSTLLSTASPWQGAAEATQLLIRRNDEPLPKGYAGQVLEGEAERVICMSCSYIAMLDKIGVIDRVVGVSGIDFVSNSYIHAHRAQIGDVGYDGNLNYELVVALDPDLVLLYGVSGASEMEGRLAELGIPYVYVGEYLEQHPLGKAEWMIFVAELVGLRAEAEKIYRPIEARYEAIAQSAQCEPKPRVMFNSPYRENWFMPPANSYMVQLLTDAGGAYIYQDDGDNRSDVIDIEEAYLLASEADIWLNPGIFHTLEELSSRFPRFADVRAVREKQVWNNNARLSPAGGNDFWEQGVVEPDVVLRDLQHLLHPELDPNYQFVYHHRLQ
ncbi:MAG: ABC transporter substrate-binding protein [Rikenellaceae bacterium]|nr:ABC transporter substrate-binding protein [Rikenellaceae bacterium]